MDNYNYPIGADNSEAPWNENTRTKKEFGVLISQSLSKSTTVYTSDYEEGEDYNDIINQQVITFNTNDTKWENVYREEHKTLQELLDILKSYIKKDIQKHKSNNNEESNIKRINYLNSLLEECEGWVENECVIMED